MIAVIESIIPVILVIAVGAALRQVEFLNEEQWQGFEKIAYYIFFPAIIMHTLANARLDEVPFWTLSATLLAVIATIMALCLVLRVPITRSGITDNPGFTSIFQGVSRWNAFVALAIAGQLYGAEGVTLIAVAIITMLPILNLCSVLVLARYGASGRPSAGAIAITLVRNPFIWAAAVGIILNVLPFDLPEIGMTTLSILGQGALVAGLIAVGSGLVIHKLKRPSNAAAIATGLRLIVTPAFTAIFGALFGLTGTALAVALITTAVPGAMGSYLMARQMGGNAELMAEILTIQTAAAMITIPVVMAVFAA